MLPIEHNRTLGNIEHNRTLHATIEHKTSFMRCVQISYVLGFNFIDEDAKMSQDGKREKFWKTRDKGYHDCPLSPSVSVKFY